MPVNHATPRQWLHIKVAINRHKQSAKNSVATSKDDLEHLPFLAAKFAYPAFAPTFAKKAHKTPPMLAKKQGSSHHFDIKQAVFGHAVMHYPHQAAKVYPPLTIPLQPKKALPVSTCHHIQSLPNAQKAWQYWQHHLMTGF